MLNFISDKAKSGQYNMEKDISLFQEIESGKNSVFFRVFSWKTPTISLGYSQAIEKELHVDKCRKNGVEIVKRPTGGGMVFHNIHEISYSIIAPIDIFPKGLTNSYIFISEIIVKSLQDLGVLAEIVNKNPIRLRQPDLPVFEIDRNLAKFCFLYPNEHEIMVNGKKIVGSAQKRGKNALLQQGSIFIAENNQIFNDCIQDQDLLSYFKEASISINQVLGRLVSLEEIYASIQRSAAL